MKTEIEKGYPQELRGVAISHDCLVKNYYNKFLKRKIIKHRDPITINLVVGFNNIVEKVIKGKVCLPPKSCRKNCPRDNQSGAFTMAL